MIEALRFVSRDGKKRLQMADQCTIEDGEILYNWQDVDYVAPEDEAKDASNL